MKHLILVSHSITTCGIEQLLICLFSMTWSLSRPSRWSWLRKRQTVSKYKWGRYGANKRCQHPDGTKFDSKREMERYCELLLMWRAGAISDLKVHPRYPIIIGGIPIRIQSKRYNKDGRQMVYVADFSYIEHSTYKGQRVQRPVIEDVKMQSGHRTEVYKIKRALMYAVGLTITEV